uniref:Uncharacterized protein n=1 Tax=Timema tahoe TaxID=61484 RepID=A0A7R9NVZ3_9NEOP|nr:unnamed protein product [Timema tahoe]
MVSGVNSGVMLMNLTRMRLFSWTDYVAPIYKEYKLTMTWGDQDIINIIFHFHPAMYFFTDKLYVYPCRYNYRPDHCMYMSVCHGAEQLGVAVLHGSRGSFHAEKLPAFRAIFKATEENQIDDIPNNIIYILDLYLYRGTLIWNPSIKIDGKVISRSHVVRYLDKNRNFTAHMEEVVGKALKRESPVGDSPALFRINKVGVISQITGEVAATYSQPSAGKVRGAPPTIGGECTTGGCHQKSLALLGVNDNPALSRATMAASVTSPTAGEVGASRSQKEDSVLLKADESSTGEAIGAPPTTGASSGLGLRISAGSLQSVGINADVGESSGNPPSTGGVRAADGQKALKALFRSDSPQTGKEGKSSRQHDGLKHNSANISTSRGNPGSPLLIKTASRPDLSLMRDESSQMLYDEFNGPAHKAKGKIPPIILCDVEDYSKVARAIQSKVREPVEAIRQPGIQHWSYELGRERLVRVVVKGLLTQTSPGDIQEELVEMGSPVKSITQMLSQWKWDQKTRERQRLLNFVVRLPESIPQGCIPHQPFAVRVEKYKSPRCSFHCKNRFRFGHVWKDCHANPRCGFCGGDHERVTCPEERKSPPKCLHSSAWRGCLTYKSLRVAGTVRASKAREGRMNGLSEVQKPSGHVAVRKATVTPALTPKLMVKSLASALSGRPTPPLRADEPAKSPFQNQPRLVLPFGRGPVQDRSSIPIPSKPSNHTPLPPPSPPTPEKRRLESSKIVLSYSRAFRDWSHGNFHSFSLIRSRNPRGVTVATWS